MNRWFNKCVVHLMLALVNFPIWYQPIAILDAQPVEITEEEFTTAEELKQSNEQLILPDKCFATRVYLNERGTKTTSRCPNHATGKKTDIK